MIWIAGFLILIAFAVGAFLRHPKFGAKPSGKRLDRIKASPNFREGEFQNLSETPQLTEDTNMLGILYTQLFKKAPRKRPSSVIPSVKVDLKSLPSGENTLVWFGHSSYLMQIDGNRILVDPVFSGNASPLPGTMKSFPGTDMYGVDDLPEIDILLLSHDHYDHLDYRTIVELKGKVGRIVTALGVGAHLEKWGYAPDQITETDWHESVNLGSELMLFTCPARHFSGRSFKRNQTLWQSFVLKTSTLNLFLGGDSGFDTHFKDIGEKYGPFDLAILENGQYDKRWRYIHSLPEEQLAIAEALNTKHVLSVHSSKFDLANHSWDEPLVKIHENFRDSPIGLVTPKIGKLVYLDNPKHASDKWWLGME